MCRNKILFQKVTKMIHYKKELKREQSISICLNLLHNLDISIQPKIIGNTTEPPWLFKTSWFILSMTDLRKTTTFPIIYQQTLYGITQDLPEQMWNFLFTDGSKTKDFTSFATVKHNGELFLKLYCRSVCKIPCCKIHLKIQMEVHCVY